MHSVERANDTLMRAGAHPRAGPGPGPLSGCLTRPGRAVRGGLLRSPPPQPLGAGHRHGVERQEPRQTQELLRGPGELRAAAQPVAQPLQVEPRHPLAVGVGQRVEAAQLLQVLPVAGAPAVGCHDAEEGPVGAASESEPDHDVPAAVALQEAAAQLHHDGGRVLSAAQRDDARGAGSAAAGREDGRTGPGPGPGSGPGSGSGPGGAASPLPLLPGAACSEACFLLAGSGFDSS